MNQKPNVFSKKHTITTGATEVLQSLNLKPEEKEEVINEVYSATPDISLLDANEQIRMKHQLDAVEQMRLRTEEQIRLRNEQLDKNKKLTADFNTMTQNATDRTIQDKKNMENVNVPRETTIEKPKSTPIIKPTTNMNQHIESISQPQFNTAFDLLPLPSEGKLYHNKRSSVRVAYMTTADENILTSPNLLASGQFLEILINRKLLETDMRFNDLHVGDRNAIMIWLRGTSYGFMYPVTLFDENNEPFETEIDLSKLKVKNLGAEPDAEGLFDFHFKLCGSNIKFKLLTVGDVNEIDAMLESDTANEVPINNANTYSLRKHIVEVDGNRDAEAINRFVDSLRVGDAKAFRSYVDEIESGIDLNITVSTPGGGTIDTFLPLNVNFFWPDLRL